MNTPFISKLPTFDADSISATIERALASAGLQTQTGPLLGVTDVIRRALAVPQVGPAPFAGTDASVIDVVAREVGQNADAPAGPDRPADAADTVRPGSFVTRQFRNHAGARAYKLYVPAAAAEAPMPLVVMLHGCTQSPDDFAAGTQMNRLAEQHGFIVVYPEQAANANGSKCWNWFQTQDQARDRGEPSLIAGITREVAAHYPVDPRRVYVAGLSAGAAMAVILGETYPELYAGVGAHSGLPYAAAHDMPSAFAAMKKSRAPGPESKLPGMPTPAAGRATHFVPTIVFHGDRDQTVRLGNGADIVAQALHALGAEPNAPVLTAATQSGAAAGGRHFSRTAYTDPSGRSRIESWVLRGAGHAWSGGAAAGSYTDATGPDASAEMIRFFLSQPPAGSA